MDVSKAIREHYSKIGKKGGKKTAERGTQYYSDLGKKGALKRWGKKKIEKSAIRKTEEVSPEGELTIDC